MCRLVVLWWGSGPIDRAISVIRLDRNEFQTLSFEENDNLEFVTGCVVWHTVGG